MSASWEPVAVSRLELPRCGAAKPVPIPEGDSSSVGSDDSITPRPDSAADACRGWAEGGPMDADTDHALADTGSFGRLLVCLASEHRRELARLRAELENKAAFPACAATAAQNETKAASAPDATAAQDEATVAPSPDAATAAQSEVEVAPEPQPSRRSRLSTRGSKHSLEPAAESMFSRATRVGSRHRLSPFDFGSETDPEARESGQKDEEEGRSLDRVTSFLQTDSSGSHGRIRFDSLKRVSVQIARQSSSVGLRRLVTRCVGSQAFDTLSGIFILLNSVLLGWAADLSVQNAVSGIHPDEMPTEFKVMTISFTLWFAVELALRAAVVGPRKFFSNEDWTWNAFDSFTVGTDVIHSILELTSITRSSNAAVQNLTVVRMLRIMRITRAIRMVRLIRFFRELRMMVFSVLRSGSSLLWSLLMVVTTIYIFGIYFVQVVAHHLYASDVPPKDTPEFAAYKATREMFGSLLLSVYTLYQAVSGGISWGEIGSVLIAIEPLHGIVLCFFTFFTTFALLNIITGIFVDTSINCAQSDKQEVIQEQIHRESSALTDMKKLFHNADRDGSGTMSLEEFKTHLQSKEVRAYFNSLGLGVDRVTGLFRLLDLDKSGELSLEEFVHGCHRLKGPARSMDLAMLLNEYMQMSDDLTRFFSWSDKQFRRLYALQERLASQLDGLLADMS